MHEKLLTRAQLAERVHALKAQNKIIVTTNGSFDLLHIGHVTMLREAKSLGDALIVGVNSDRSIKRYKGKARPICPEAHRVGMLAALECTDYITVFDELTPLGLLEIIQPHIHVNSPEHGRECVELDVVERHGGRIHLAALVEGMSTTDLLRRITESLNHPGCRAAFLRAPDACDPAALHALLDKGFRVFLSGAERSPAFSNAIIMPQPELTAALAEQMAEAHDLILAKSVIISRAMADIRLGRELNCKTILLADASAAPLECASGGAPHIVARTLAEAIAAA